MVIDGKQIARKIIGELEGREKPSGELVVLWVGEHHASEKFIREKERVAEELGVSFRIEQPQTERDLRERIENLNKDARVEGIILQLPLPSGFDTDYFISLINPEKDVDALGEHALVLPPVVRVVKAVLDELGFSVTGKRAVVVGRGKLVGAPILKWLSGKVKELDQFHTEHFDSVKLSEADLIISGIGRPGFIKGDHVKPGAILIDFGYGIKDGKVRGDFDFETCEKIATITPTPGGTGPILVAELFRNFFELRN